MRLRFYKQGMTLMEMMITLLIITILAIVTYSGYQSYVKKIAYNTSPSSNVGEYAFFRTILCKKI